MTVAINVNDLIDKAANKDSSYAVVFATQKEATDGINNSVAMSPLATKQAVINNGTDSVKNLGTSIGNVSIDPDASKNFAIEIGGDTDITLLSPVNSYRSINIFITNGSLYTLTWNNTIKWDDTSSLVEYGINIVSLTTIDNGESWLGDIIYSYTDSNPNIGNEVEEEWLDNGQVRYYSQP